MHSTPEPRIREATQADLAPLSRLFARAFAENPLHRWLFPDETVRTRKHHRFFAIALSEPIRHREMWVSDDLQGAIGWVPPDKAHPSLPSLAVVGARYAWLLGLRTGALIRGIHAINVHYPRYPHWYLRIAATAPELEGRGIGTRLLDQGLERCDCQGLPAYAEASSEGSARFYERHGFSIAAEIRLPNGPSVWPMTRPASLERAST